MGIAYFFKSARVFVTRSAGRISRRVGQVKKMAIVEPFLAGQRIYFSLVDLHLRLLQVPALLSLVEVQLLLRVALGLPQGRFGARAGSLTETATNV